MTNNDISIDVRNLNLEYRVYQYRSTTLKEFVMNRMKGRGSYQLIKALSGINFEIRKGESVALIGHNGCGKSTLLKCIAGIYQPEGAEISVNGRTAPMIELGAGFDGELSGLENIRLSCMLMGLTSEEIDRKIDGIVRFSELREFIHIPFKNYSSGMQARLGFACATAVDPDVLLIDEVLAVGDSNFARKCLERVHSLKEKGTTVVLVSHDVGTVMAFCTRGIVIDEGKVQFDGPITEAISCQDKIMDRRYLDSLPEEEKFEILRLRALHEDQDEVDRNGRKGVPLVHTYFQAFQNEMPTSVVDVSRPFELLFRLRAENSELFDGDISLGFGFNCASGVRVGGYNNLADGLKIHPENFLAGKMAEVRFSFREGMGCLAPGEYKIMCGVHDRGIQRTLFIGDVADISINNSKVGINMDGDIVAFSQLVSGVELDWKLGLDV